MDTISLDAALRQRLNGLNQPLQVCDESGNVVGHFLPRDQYERMLYLLAEAQCPYSATELAQMKAETGGQELRQFKESLGLH